MSSTYDDAHIHPEYVLGRLKAIRDKRMRILSLVSALADGTPNSWVDAIATIIARAHQTGDVDAMLALDCITHAAASPILSYTTRQALYEAAITCERPAIARLFLTISPPPRALGASARAQLGPERPLVPSGRALTLGERKALARTHRRDQILLLVRDPHPAVVAILLDNPHLAESDVLVIASMRPAVPASLASVATHAKWSAQHAVKRALVQNPSTPLADAIRIATTLRGTELAELATDPALPEPLRAHAAELRRLLR